MVRAFDEAVLLCSGRWAPTPWRGIQGPLAMPLLPQRASEGGVAQQAGGCRKEMGKSSQKRGSSGLAELPVCLWGGSPLCGLPSTSMDKFRRPWERARLWPNSGLPGCDWGWQCRAACPRVLIALTKYTLCSRLGDLQANVSTTPLLHLAAVKGFSGHFRRIKSLGHREGDILGWGSP